MTRHLTEIDDLTRSEVVEILDRAEDKTPAAVLQGKGVALLFEKPSNRTRNATEMAVVQLGGHPTSIQGSEVGMGTRETIEDVTRTLACYHAAIGARVFAHSTIESMAAASPVPVINLLSDDSHPCQALADLLTLRQRFGALEGLTIAYIGDANNVCRSLLLGAALTGVRVHVSSPHAYTLMDNDIDRATLLGGEVQRHDRPHEAVKDVDAIYTDVWTSMGQEAESDERRRAFEGYMIDEALMGLAASRAVFLHCLPAHRGEEVSEGVLEGPQSLVWQQAENRMHAVRGVLSFLLDAGDAR